MAEHPNRRGRNFGGPRGGREGRGDRAREGRYRGGKDRGKEERRGQQGSYERVFQNESLHRAHRKALDILKRRTALDDGFAQVLKGKEAELENDRAENQRLSQVYAYNESLLGEAGEKKAKEDRAYSDILEAMLYDGCRTLFKGTDVYVQLPSEFDDRKSGVDLVLAIKKEDGSLDAVIGVDATTEVDVAGYDDAHGGKKKGLEDKFKRSLRTTATNFNNLVRIKYGDIAGKKQMIEDMPRVLAGASTKSIEEAADLWQKGELDPKTHPLFAQIVHSIPKQLGAIQMMIADREQREGKPNRQREIMKHAYKAFGERVKDIPHVPVTDAVVSKIIGVTGPEYRKRHRTEALAEQREMNDVMGRGAEFKKSLDQALSPEEQTKLDEHFKDVKVDAGIEKALRDFLAGTRKDFDPRWISAVAVGIPTRVFRRLQQAPRPAPVSPTPEPKKEDPPKEPQHTSHAPHAPHAPHAHGEAHGHGAHGGDVHGHAAAIAKARASLGLPAVHGAHDAHGGGHGGGHGHESHGHSAGGGIEKYQSKWARIWSRTKEMSVRLFAGKIGGIVGATAGMLASLGAWTLLPTFGGAALSQWALNKFFFKKKGYDKKFEARDKIAALESLDKDMKKMPWTYRHMFEQAAKKGEDKNTWIENELIARAKWSRIKRNVGAAAITGLTSLEVGSWIKGRSLSHEIVQNLRSPNPDWQKTWGIFTKDWGSRPPQSGGRTGAGALSQQGGGGRTNGNFQPLTRGGFQDPFNQFKGTGRKPSFRELMGSCLQQQYERVYRNGQPQWGIYTGRGHVNMYGSGRWR